MELPIRPTSDEQAPISRAIGFVRQNLAVAQKEEPAIRAKIAKDTGGGDYLGFCDEHEDLLFGWLNNSAGLAALLLISHRYGMNPDEVAALWVGEGFATLWHDELPGERVFEEFSKYYNRRPRDEGEALCWARSAIFWNRWGLDELTPIHSGRLDNELQPSARAADHDAAFVAGVTRWVEAGYLQGTNPTALLDYYSRPASHGGPFEIDMSSGNGRFRPFTSYQATTLLLQHIRFVAQEIKIPEYMDRVSLRPLSEFPALLKLFFNSKNAKDHLKHLMIPKLKQSRPRPRGEYSIVELREAFFGSRIPKTVRDYVDRIRTEKRGMLNSHGYVNAIRFEYLRRVYAVLFARSG